MEFQQYCKHYNKNYYNPFEYYSRRKNFERTMNELRNAYDVNHPDYEDLGDVKLGFNELSDRSLEEYKKMNGRLNKLNLARSSNTYLTEQELKSFIDKGPY